jgi:hypothetical protein
MSTEIQQFNLEFPDWYDERAEYEAPFKGWLDGVVVQLEDGSRYRLCFYDPVRLQQTLEDDAKSGHAYFAEPNLVVVPEVNTDAIQTTIAELVRDHFFEHLKPIP